MYNQVIKTKIPEVKSSDITPKTYSVEFLIAPLRTKRPFNNQAKVLEEHINIVEESRQLIKEGKFVTWKDYLKAHGKKQKNRKRRV